ncbi:MAG: extracellular solute-binding protein [Candidatus Hydrogenedentota bacterium]|nr:MAG: extracellular solute-binding protein [Candidatus Hydrogenedentota bacterium]
MPEEPETTGASGRNPLLLLLLLYSALVTAALVALLPYYLDVTRENRSFSSSPPVTYPEPLIIWLYGTESEMVHTILPFFQRAYRQYEVRVVPKTWSSPAAVDLVALPPDLWPDLIQIGSTWLPELADKDLILPLDPYLSHSFIEASDFAKNSWSLYRYRNHQYAIPWYIDVRALYYRSDLLPSPPKTWNEVLRLRRTRSRKYRYPLTFALDDPKNFLMLYWAAGGTLSRPDPLVLKKSLKRYKQLLLSRIVPSGPFENTRDPEAVLASGYCAAMISGPWHLRALEREFPQVSDSWATAPLPADSTTVSFLGGAGWAIPKHAKNPEGAWTFIEYMTHVERQKEWWRAVGNLPAVQAAWDSSIETNPHLAGFAAMLSHLRHPPVDPRWNETEREWKNILDDYTSGKITLTRARTEMLRSLKWLRSNNSNL